MNLTLWASLLFCSASTALTLPNSLNREDLSLPLSSPSFGSLLLEEPYGQLNSTEALGVPIPKSDVPGVSLNFHGSSGRRSMKGGQLVYSLLSTIFNLWMRNPNDPTPLPSVFVNPSFPIQIALTQMSSKLDAGILGYGIMYTLGKLFGDHQIWLDRILVRFVDQASEQEFATMRVEEGSRPVDLLSANQTAIKDTMSDAANDKSTTTTTELEFFDGLKTSCTTTCALNANPTRAIRDHVWLLLYSGILDLALSHPPKQSMTILFPPDKNYLKLYTRDRKVKMLFQITPEAYEPRRGLTLARMVGIMLKYLEQYARRDIWHEAWIDLRAQGTVVGRMEITRQDSLRGVTTE